MQLLPLVGMLLLGHGSNTALVGTAPRFWVTAALLPQVGTTPCSRVTAALLPQVGTAQCSRVTAATLPWFGMLLLLVRDSGAACSFRLTVSIGAAIAHAQIWLSNARARRNPPTHSAWVRAGKSLRGA